jgi:N-terminal half of MaoC dehydratase
MTLSQVPGNDEGVTYSGVQNNPKIGDKLEPVDIVADEEFVRDYVNATGDETFWAFRASVRARHGTDVSPLTMFDRDIGARLVGISARFGLHAKQEFNFHGPVTPGGTYRLSGEVVDVFEKRGIEYFTTRCYCHPIDDPEQILLDSRYTRAYKFPSNQYPQGREDRRSRFSDWLQANGARARETFPNPGAIVEGRTRLLDQARLNLYSGPGSGAHTDSQLARQGGLKGTVGQALMLTELESELYRDLFGLDFYTKGSMRSSFIATIPVGVQVRAAAVVDSVTNGEIVLRSAVASTTGDLLSVGTSTIKDWP